MGLRLGRLALVSAVIGPAWHFLDPFSTLYDIGAWVVRRLDVQPWTPADYPERLGRWPAVIAFAAFVWLELVDAGGGPSTLFVVLVGYTAFTLAMMVQFGRDTWRANGETFTVWFRLLGRLAPFGLADEDGRVRRRPFVSGLLEPGWATSDAVLTALGVGSILFDGLSQTQLWFDLFGAPGIPGETLLLVGWLGLLVAAALLLTRVVGVAATGAGLLPIAVGYLIAHYLTYLLIDGQNILVAISDPFQQGWDLFGTAFHEASGAWLPPGLVWTLQLASVVGGHMLGAWAGHVNAAAHAPAGARSGHDPATRDPAGRGHGGADDADALVARPGDRGQPRISRRGRISAMTTIETIVRSINREFVPQFEERLRAILAEQEREWLIDQIVRLTLDAHSLEEIDRRVVVEAKARARAERLGRVRELGLDRPALEAFLAELAGTTRDDLIARGHLAADAPAKGTALITAKHRTETGEALLVRAKDVLFALLFGDDTTNTHLDRIQQELLTMALPIAKAAALDFMRASTELTAAGTWQDPDSVSNDERAANVLLEVQFGEIADELVGRGIVLCLSLINNLEVNEQILYARMINVEETTLIS